MLAAPNMWLIVGLGNPGTQYERNRHNIGFSAVETIAEKYGAFSWTKKFRGALCEAKFKDSKLFFLKPQTYMNLSGESVIAAAQFYKIQPENIIVIHDEIDLLPGKLRVKQGGGHGGHNGIKSIDAHIGQDYWRVRIGVGRPEFGDVADYVLGDFNKEEIKLQQKMIEAIAQDFPLLIEKDEATFMNKVALEMKS